MATTFLIKKVHRHSHRVIGYLNSKQTRWIPLRQKKNLATLTEQEADERIKACILKNKEASKYYFFKTILI
jgi:hypothetical protein